MRRRISAVSMILGILLLLGCGTRILLAAGHNSKVINEFDRVEYAAEQYEQKLPMEQISFRRCATVLADIGDFAEGKTYTLQTDLHFYDSADASVPAVILKKGTKIYSRPPVAINANNEKSYNIPPYGYGFLNTVPTYDRDWRYTRLPLKADEDGLAEDQPYYYLRTSEMLKELKLYMAQERSTYQDTSLEEAAFSTDNWFYEEGAYISPNLLTPLWDGWNTAMAAVGVCLLVFGVLFPRIKKKTGTADAE